MFACTMGIMQGLDTELISDSGAGKIVESENPESMTRGILQLFQMSDAQRDEPTIPHKKFLAELKNDGLL